MRTTPRTLRCIICDFIFKRRKRATCPKCGCRIFTDPNNPDVVYEDI